MKKIIIFTNTDWHFYNHLLPIALTAKIKGYEVKVLTDISEFKDKIEQHNLPVIPISIKRGSINLFTDLLLLIKLIRILNKEKPDILHNFTIKPIFYGSISAFLCNTPQIINTFVGMGLLFISNKFLLKCLRKIIVKILSLISYYKSMLFVVQNDDDLALVVKLGIAPPNLVIKQCSVGIETKKFPLLPEPLGNKIVVALVARMLIDKGVYEFIYAAKILKQKNIDAEFWLVGQPEQNNKQSIAQSILEDYQNLGYIKYLGYQKDIEEIWKKAHIAVLPSYREGLSRSLLEAGAYGRAIITTNAPGGRELIQDKINGLLVKPQNIEDLAIAMELLITRPSLRKHLGIKIRQDILEKYDNQLISEKMVNFYG
ncbi:glycosyltransferase family 4 protein [Rickettsia endosymbiont of Culicoides newsteadi]|uniref:glycosyltransferase family 4 protein n=1 Tax=Rickettsia endosymbiont of Culicoides newsteadi TaxID=1961830 RepID=UPI000B9B5F1C|nr:glycosyltransferase family 4 protein [Rickettsia endosymbiont of Culicoides newsteadi]OZG31708.1 glycosyl transferase family 1 [Rickettsia endosymbiont of Culicoides newsteadi]